MKSGFEITQEFFDLWQKMYKDTYGKLVELPAFGPMREKQEKISKEFSASVNLYSSLAEFNLNLFSVIMQANQKTYEKIIEDMSKSKEWKDIGYKEWYNIWIDTYSEVFKQFIRSGHFSTDMGRLTSDMIECQKYNKELLEENVLKPLKLPTRTEIDAINKDIYELRKELKEIKRKENIDLESDEQVREQTERIMV